MFFIKLFEINR